ncbi:MAG: uroporphyrinogen-III synthase [Chloroflexi bacterium]|nr:uroporphyrinogen-III synthase [Chloroflexota bacterium]
MKHTEESLAGKGIVVTRARRQADALATMIRARGAVSLLYPCLAIAPADDLSPLDDALCRLGEFDWLVFTSGNAVAALADRLRILSCQPDWAQLSIAAVGAQTNEAVKSAFGRSADFLPEQADALALAQTLPVHAATRIVLPQADRANPATAQIFSERGAVVSKITAYRTILGSGGVDLAAELARGNVHALTFASPSAVEFLWQRCPQPKLFELPAACIGAATAAAARRRGFSRLVVPQVSGLANMLAALGDFFLSQKNMPESL